MKTPIEIKLINCPTCGAHPSKPKKGEFKSYPSPRCRHISAEEGRKAGQNARQFRIRNKIIPKTFSESFVPYVNSLLEHCPTDQEEFCEYTRREMIKAREALASGEIDLARDHAEAARVLVAGDQSTDAWRIKLQCEEVLLNSRTTPYSQDLFPLLKERALDIVKYHDLQRDRLSFAASLLTYGNLEQTYLDKDANPQWKKHINRALEATQAALNVLVELRGKKIGDQHLVTMLLHKVIVRKARMFIEHFEPLHKLQEIHLLYSLAAEIDSPIAWLETYREEVRNLIYLGERDLAEQGIVKMRNRLDLLPSYSPLLLMSILSLEIALYSPRDCTEVAPLLQQYVALGRKYPTLYHLRYIRCWERHFGIRVFDPKIQDTLFYTPILACMYLEKDWRERT